MYERKMRTNLFVIFNFLLSVLCNTSTPLGMKSGVIPDERITASSMFNQNHRPALARLDYKAVPGSAGSWVSGHQNADQWLQVDLGLITKVMEIATQGRQEYPQWVASYFLQYSLNGINFVDDEEDKIFPGNTDQNSIVKHALKSAIIARYIRVRPKTWFGTISMRMELYGCK
jgi:hypothetical protein